MERDPLRIIQISDLHLKADLQGSLLGVKTQESFNAVLALLKRKEKRIDIILLSGDLSQDGSAAAYLRIAELVKPFQVPVYYVCGNHDDFQMMTTVYPRETISNQKHIVLVHWQLILLNSQKTGAVEGYLDANQLAYLQDCLQSYPEHQAVIMFHHQPVVLGCHWLDNIGLKNAVDFWQIVEGHRNVNTVLFGHAHQEYENVFQQVKCYGVPSTCIQFMRKQDKFGLEHLPPGYRWVNLYDDGRLETGIERVDQYIGDFDQHAKGY